MSFEIGGRLFHVAPEQSGQGKNGTWTKQEFVIETTDQYPKKVCFTVWGEKTSALKSLKAGEEVKVSFDVESREYNGKWYSDLKAWRVVSGSAAAPAPQRSNAAPEVGSSFEASPFDMSDEGDLPF
jgi:hypothetical protein